MPVVAFLIVFALTFCAALLGLFLATVLPKHHMTEESQRAIHSFLELNGLLAAVVLGFLVFSAKTSFDTKDTEWRHASAEVILLDRLMSHYGPETRDLRALLRKAVASKLAQFKKSRKPTELVVGIDQVQLQLSSLVPTTDAQSWLKSRALDVTNEIAQTRWFLLDDVDSTMPIPFLALLILWLAIIFFGNALFAPRNTTVLSIIALCAVVLAGSVFLIMEMDESQGGLISISSAPLHEALTELTPGQAH